MRNYSTVLDIEPVKLISKNLYVFMIMFWVVIGIISSAIGAYYTQEWEVNSLGIIGTLIVTLIGVRTAKKSKNPLVSLFGFMLVTIPFGLLMGPVVAQYTQASVIRVFFVTASVVAVLGVVGAVIPDNLEGFGGWLFGGLLVLLIGTFAIPIASFFGLPVEGAMSLLDWAGIILFCGYVVFDLNKAMKRPYTHDNAIDSAMDVYLDFLNIFLRYLNQSGTKKK